ncbi:SLATT domain-containing protein [Longimicrobium sp.]|uniref:SLATT domain-containing protein n=1 Tax=Longimicrobium sp. TaxID=2029185 RepID=UPI003B3BCB65
MSQNLSAIQLETISWEDGNRAASLTSVYTRVTDAARSASAWYQINKKPKKGGAMFLRWGAVVLISISGLLPLISALLPPVGSPPSRLEINPLYTSLAVAVAAALFGLDKFFNYSSGWMRYVKTDLALRTAIGEFELDWQIARAAWGAAEPTLAQTADMLARCKAFAARVNAIESEETNLWIAEFQASLAQLGESVKTEKPREEPRPDPTPAETRKLPANAVTGGKVFTDALPEETSDFPDAVADRANEPAPREPAAPVGKDVPPAVSDPSKEPTRSADREVEPAAG